MVARGDFSVEVGVLKVPYIQKILLERARLNNKYSIVATQIMDSMEHNPTPTRAEVSDATNALIDGAKAPMLSGETAIGQYLVETIQMLSDIIHYNSAFEI